MHRIDTSTAQKDKFGVGKNGFTTGDPQSGTPATEVSADILDALQEEIAAVIEDPDSGLTLSKSNNAQLLAAIKKIITAKSINQSTLKTMFAGMAFPWPTATPPDGFIALTGQAINQATDPLLYARFGATAPDMRGEIVRGYDNGRGVDAGRILLSAQLDQIQTIMGTLSNPGGTLQFLGENITATGAFTISGTGTGIPDQAGATCPTSLSLNSSLVARSGTETRMRNVAWNYVTMRG